MTRAGLTGRNNVYSFLFLTFLPSLINVWWSFLSRQAVWPITVNVAISWDFTLCDAETRHRWHRLHSLSVYKCIWMVSLLDLHPIAKTCGSIVMAENLMYFRLIFQVFAAHFWVDYLTKPLINTTIEYRRPSRSCQTLNIYYTTNTFTLLWDTVV